MIRLFLSLTSSTLQTAYFGNRNAIDNLKKFRELRISFHVDGRRLILQTGSQGP